MTPVGLLALVAVAFFGPLFAPVLAVARFLVVVVVVSVTVGKTLGREFPVSEVQQCSGKLRAELYCKLTAATWGYGKYEPVADRVPSRAIVSCKLFSKIVCCGGLR